MVQTVQKHLGQVVHGLPVLLGQVSKLVEHKVGDPFGDARLLEGWVSLKNETFGKTQAKRRKLGTRYIRLKMVISFSLIQWVIHF